LAQIADGRIVCKLRSDNTGTFFFLLDSAEKTRVVEFYVSPDWDRWDQSDVLLWDDAVPTETEKALCDYLIATWRMEGKYPGVWLESWKDTHRITACYNQLEGLRFVLLVMVYYDGKHIAVGNAYDDFPVEVSIPEALCEPLQGSQSKDG
jgi:hypothetical protein